MVQSEQAMNANGVFLTSPPEINRMGASSAQMIPVDEVSAIIQRITTEHELRLKQERKAIVQEVLASLREGSRQTEAKDEHVNAAFSTHLPPERLVGISNHNCHQRHVNTPTRLEKNIHSLMLHSLSENGLGYPHVQRTAVGTSASKTPLHGTPLHGGDSSQCSQPLILCRAEAADNSPSIELSCNISSQHYPLEFDTRSGQGGHETHSDMVSSSRSGKKKPTHSKASRSGPIRKDHPLRISRRKSSDTLVDASVDESFRSVRSKIDHRTLAILDKSRALIGQTPQLPETLASVAELRQKYRAAVQKPIAESGIQEKEGETEESADPHVSESESSHLQEAIPPSTAMDTSARNCVNAQTSANSNIESQVRCDIELLQPPEDPPEDENEWENELARQILTIYATSVKAKADAAEAMTNRPTSSSSRCNARTPNRSTRRPGASSSGLLPVLTQHARGTTKPESCQPPTAVSRLNASVNFSWEPSQRLQDGKVVVNMPKIPKPIWFAGTGAVKAVWCALTEGYGELTSSPGQATSQSLSALCSHRLCEEVRRMEAQQKFIECVTSIESLLIALVRARGASDLEIKLWEQLVVTCNAFASRCIDYKRFSAALKLMKQVEHLVDNSVLVDGVMRLELLAYLYDTYAHYYYRRRKPHAGFEYCRKALEIHARQSSWAHVAKTRLHVAALLSFQKKHAQALAQLASILELIEANKLEEGGASGQKLCLVSVCYNNLAVEQLHQRAFEAAGVAADNAQRLARLCLSYSNRWLAQLDATRQCVALAVATLLEPINKA